MLNTDLGKNLEVISNIGVIERIVGVFKKASLQAGTEFRLLTVLLHCLVQCLLILGDNNLKHATSLARNVRFSRLLLLSLFILYSVAYY
jgi:hypothetical protein